MKAKKCPYCNHPIRFAQIGGYLFKGTAHVVKCDCCGRLLRPSKYYFTFERTYVFSLLYTIVFMNVMLFVLHLGFVESIMYFLVSIVIIVSEIAVGIFKTIDFKGDDDSLR